MAEKKLNIKVSTTGAKKSQKNLKGLSGSMKSLGASALAAGAAYFATRGLINGIASAMRLAGEQEQAEKKLSTALGHTSKALLNHASALQKMTTFGDEAIIGVQSSLAAFIKNEEQIKKATVAVLDISVAMGMDLKAAGDLVAKTLGSSMNAMSRYGVVVEGAVGSTERLESLTNNVATLFGGQASAQADTYAGSVQQMKNALGDMGEQIGGILIPVFERLEPHLSLAIDFWSKYLDVGGKAAESQSSFTDEIKNANIEIDKQKEFLDFLTSETYIEFELVKIRAAEASRELSAQLIWEGENLANHKVKLEELTTALDNLNIAQEHELTIKKLTNEQNQIGLEIRRGELEMAVEYVKVIDPATKGNTVFAASFDDVAGASSTALKQTSDLLAATSGDSKKQQVQAMRLAQFAAIADTASGVMKAFKQGGTLGFITGAGIAATGAAQVATIQQAISNAQGAETGFDGIVNKPTMFMTGEGNKAEHVSVTPLQGPNINGPQGGITLNITAPLIDEHILDSIIPAIQRAQRMNLA